jgi:hypothetical protein
LLGSHPCKLDRSVLGWLARRYLVEWLGFGMNERTWEPAFSLRHCPQLLDAFHSANPAILETNAANPTTNGTSRHEKARQHDGSGGSGLKLPDKMFRGKAEVATTMENASRCSGSGRRGRVATSPRVVAVTVARSKHKSRRASIVASEDLSNGAPQPTAGLSRVNGTRPPHLSAAQPNRISAVRSEQANKRLATSAFGVDWEQARDTHPAPPAAVAEIIDWVGSYLAKRPRWCPADEL